jgi:predicted tellurium resistance membrane protein TerC
MAWVTNPESWIALVTLTVMELVLGVDNIIFISIMSGKLRTREEQARARRIGLMLAMGMRILLLVTLAWVIGLTAPLFNLFGHPVSGRDLVLLGGGLFLIYKATDEIHERLNGETEGHPRERTASSLVSVVVQIMLLDIVFSLDSVITAVGMADDLPVMIAAVVIAVLVMLVAAGAISDFVNRHPTVKILALSFLLLIGVTLLADGLSFHIPKAYIYFAMAFSVFVELLNQFGRRRSPAEAAEPAVRPTEVGRTEVGKTGE